MSWKDKFTSQTPENPMNAQGGQNLSQQGQVVFPPNHGLCLLRQLWDSQVGKEEPLTCSLMLQDQNCLHLTAKQLSQEKRWVQIVLDYVSTVRMGQVYPDGKGPVDQDEVAVIFPSSDELVAWLMLLPPVGAGKTLSSSRIQSLLQEHGIIYGVNWNLLCGLSGSTHRYFRLIQIARCKLPVPGRDGRIEDCYSRDLVPEIQSHALEQVDYQELRLAQPIEEGDVICRIVPATPGMPGRTVTGKTIPAPHGKEPAIPQGRNTCISEDGKSLVAQRKGNLTFLGKLFQVKAVWDIYEEDLEDQEKINFLGDIHIHCDVGGGIFICASGNIQIDGVLEACTVQAGENIVLSSGVQGQGNATLQAHKSVYAKYMEHCQVYAQEHVFADCLINCQVYANGSVYVRTGRGVLVGGTVQAAGQVSATTVGSKAECTTQIVLGGNPCQQAERMYILKEIIHLEEEQKQLEAHTYPEAESRKAKLRLNLCVARMRLEKMDKENEQSNQEHESNNHAQLICDTAYPGTVVTTEHSSLTITREEHNCTLGLVGGVVGRC